MIRKSLKSKIILPTILVLVVLLTILIAVFVINFDRYTKILFGERIEVTAQSLKQYLEDSKHKSKMAAIAVSHDECVVNAIADGDENRINELLSETLGDFAVDYYVVTDETGVVLARTTADITGDSILDKATIREALEGRVHSCIEEGPTIKVSVRTGAPVYNSDGMLIGAVSAGVRLDTNESLDHLKEKFNAEFSVMLGDTRIATTVEVDGKRITGTKINPNTARVVLESGEEYFGKSEILGDEYSAVYIPLENHDGEVFAILFVGQSNSSLIAERTSMSGLVVLIGIVGLIIAIVMLWVIISKITQPVRRVAHLVSEVTRGNFSTEMDRRGTGGDEVGLLTQDVFSLIDVVDMLIGDLTQLTGDLNIFGNIDYTIDTGKYSGAYKEIIEGIKVLADSISSMKKTMAIADDLDTMITVVDLEYNLIYTSRSIEKVFNVDRESCLGKKCYKAIRGLDGPCPVCKLPTMLHDVDSNPVVTYHSVWDECSGMWIGGRAAVIDWLDGSKVFLNTINDETQIMNYEMQVRESNERAMLMLDTSPLCAQIWSRDLETIDCNNAAVKLFGLRSKQEYIDIFHKSCSPEFQPDGKRSQEKAVEAVKKAFSEGYCQLEWLHKSPGDDTLIPAEVTLVRAGYKGEDVVVGYIRDLREHKRMMQEIYDRETKLTVMNENSKIQLAKYNVVVEASKLGLWEVVINYDSADPQYAFWWSDEFRQMLGYSNETDFPNTLDSWYDNLHPDDKENAHKAIADHLADITDQTPYDMECRMLKKNGEYSYYHTAGKTTRDENGNAMRVIGALKDITDSKNNMLELEKWAREAEAANRAKSAFIANMSHEIRTPLNSIIGFSELAHDDEVPTKTKEYLGRITNSAKWLLQIINDILDISKIESGNIELESIPFDLHDLISSCESIISPWAFEKNIDLYIYAEASTRKRLRGDPTRLRQVLINLLSNAVKFTEKGEVCLFLSVDSVGENTITIRFEVKDTGVGMTPEQIEKVFDPFMQADISTTRKYGGTGLGLSITKSILEMMGSKLEIISKPRKGTQAIFTAAFDLTNAAEEASEKVDTIHKLKKPLFKGVVLVCEDNHMNQHVINEHLGRVGLRAETAENGREGVNMVQKRVNNGEKPYDLILMDIHMPVMDGIEATQKILALKAGTPIVAMTANIMTQDVDRYLKLGMKDYLGKPFTSQELWRCLLKYIIPVGVGNTADDSIYGDTLQKQLKKEFVKSNQNRFTEIKEALASGDIKLAHRLLHTLKSNAGLIGKTSLQSLAGEMESTLTKEACMVEESQMSVLETELRAVLDELKPLLNDTVGAVAQNPLSAEQTKVLFDRLEPMLKSGAAESLNHLDDVRGVPGAETLAQQIEDYDFQAALITLNKLKGSCA